MFRRATGVKEVFICFADGCSHKGKGKYIRATATVATLM
jgi:hypothetical protein